MTNDHIVFAGGGTLGHVIPGLAVAERLACSRAGVRITFAGGGRHDERRRIEAAGFDYLRVACRPWPRGPWTAGCFVVGNAAGFLAARRFLRRQRVATVVGLGGYASAPVAKAAVALGLPLVLLEPNALAGRVNRWLAPSAELICAAFDSVRAGLPRHANVIVSGTPLRGAFDRPAVDPQARERLVVVLGGSHGARSLNEAVPEFAARMVAAGWRIVHQAGEVGAAATRSHYRARGVDAAVVPFIDDVPGVLARAGLVICRAGGTTLAELAVMAAPAVVCPYPYAADEHQRCNACEFAAAGACVLVDEPRDGLARLGAEVSALLADAGRREQLSYAIHALARPDAAGRVAEVVLRQLKAGSTYVGQAFQPDVVWEAMSSWKA